MMKITVTSSTSEDFKKTGSNTFEMKESDTIAELKLEIKNVYKVAPADQRLVFVESTSRTALVDLDRKLKEYKIPNEGAIIELKKDNNPALKIADFYLLIRSWVQDSKSSKAKLMQSIAPIIDRLITLGSNSKLGPEEKYPPLTREMAKKEKKAICVGNGGLVLDLQKFLENKVQIKHKKKQIPKELKLTLTSCGKIMLWALEPFSSTDHSKLNNVDNEKIDAVIKNIQNEIIGNKGLNRRGVVIAVDELFTSQKLHLRYKSHSTGQEDGLTHAEQREILRRLYPKNNPSQEIQKSRALRSALMKRSFILNSGGTTPAEVIKRDIWAEKMVAVMKITELEYERAHQLLKDFSTENGCFPEMGPLKNMEGVFKKADRKALGKDKDFRFDWLPFQKKDMELPDILADIKDVVRGTLVYRNFDEMQKAVLKIANNCAEGSKSMPLGVKGIAKATSGFNKKQKETYRDMKVVVKLCINPKGSMALLERVNIRVKEAVIAVGKLGKTKKKDDSFTPSKKNKEKKIADIIIMDHIPFEIQFNTWRGITIKTTHPPEGMVHTKFSDWNIPKQHEFEVETMSGILFDSAKFMATCLAHLEKTVKDAKKGGDQTVTLRAEKAKGVGRKIESAYEEALLALKATSEEVLLASKATSEFTEPTLVSIKGKKMRKKKGLLHPSYAVSNVKSSNVVEDVDNDGLDLADGTEKEVKTMSTHSKKTNVKNNRKKKAEVIDPVHVTKSIEKAHAVYKMSAENPLKQKTDDVYVQIYKIGFLCDGFDAADEDCFKKFNKTLMTYDPKSKAAAKKNSGKGKEDSKEEEEESETKSASKKKKGADKVARDKKSKQKIKTIKT